MWADADVCSNWNIQLEKNKGFTSLRKYLLQEVKTYLKVKPMKSLHSHIPSLRLAMAHGTNRHKLEGGGCLCLKWSLMFPEGLKCACTFESMYHFNYFIVNLSDFKGEAAPLSDQSLMNVGECLGFWSECLNYFIIQHPSRWRSPRCWSLKERL